MKFYVILKLLGSVHAATLPEHLLSLGYGEINAKDYTFKRMVGQMDVVALSAFAVKHGLEAYICDAKTAHNIHGLPV